MIARDSADRNSRVISGLKVDTLVRSHHQLLERDLWVRLNHPDDLLGYFLIHSVLRLSVGFDLRNETIRVRNRRPKVIFSTCSLGPDTVTVSTESPFLLVGTDKTE